MTPNQNSPIGQRFLASLRLSNEDSQTKDVLISSLRNTAPEILDESFTGSVVKSEPDVSGEKVIKPLVIVKRFRPDYTEAAKSGEVQGTVRIRATFGANGNITKIIVIKGLPEGLTRQAIFATLRMKFLPFEKNAKPVSVVKMINYGFNIY